MIFTPFILFLISFLLLSILFLTIGYKAKDGGVWECIGVVGGFIFGIVTGAYILASFVGNTGISSYITKPAKVQRIDNTLVISAENFPVMTSTDMFFLDKELNIKEETPRNAWGYIMGKSYSIEEAKPKQ